MRKALSDKIGIENEINQQARSNLIAQVEEAKNKVSEIYSQENPDLNAVEVKVISILKEVPTFEEDAERLAGLDPTTLRAKLTDIVNGNDNESKALSAASDAVGQIGTGINVFEMRGHPIWHVKAAAIVRSKKYGQVDDYEYINAQSKDPLNLSSADREYVESELKSLLGQDNVKLNALNKKAIELSNELNLTKEQSQNLTSEMAKLENELSSLKILNLIYKTR